MATAMAMALDFSTPHVLRNAREYKAAVAEIDRLLDLDSKRGTPSYDRLEFLSVLVQAYEDEHDPIDDARGTPQSVVTFMLDQKGLARGDLNEVMGGKGRVSEFFAGKRPLSVAQIRGLHKVLGIPADLLLG